MVRDVHPAVPRGRRATSLMLAAMAAMAAVAVCALAWPHPSAAAEIHRCPQPDGTTRFQDRPCGAEPARPAAPAAEVDGRGGARAAPPPAARTVSAPPARPAATRPAPAVSSASSPPPFESEPGEGAGAPATRSDYIARNAARCRDGDRRACAAVTCERSGRLDSPACQEAVGYVRGAGWDLRPRTDLFDPARATDEYTLTCRGGSRRATLSRARGSEVYTWPAAPGADGAGPRDVPRAALADAAREFCAGR